MVWPETRRGSHEGKQITGEGTGDTPTKDYPTIPYFLELPAGE